MSLSGQVVMITGASSGIGRAMAFEYARRGARVGVMARREDRLRELCQSIREFGGIADHAVADASDRESTRHALFQLRDRLGPCDVLVANAGVGASNTATDLNVPGAEMVIRTNLLGPIYAFDAVLPDMLTRGKGHLVGMSSVAALKGLPTSAAYCASKSALTTYLESVRISLRSKGIAVTAIHPGFVRTEMTAKNDKMLWVVEPDVAARKFIKAIQRRRKVYTFPRRMGWLVSATRWLPDRLIAKMIPE